MRKYTWMIYGATGYTGQLIVREAIRLGEKPLLAGRSSEKLSLLAKETGLDWVAFDLNNTKALLEQLANTELLLQCAGPFTNFAPKIIEACLKAGTHYTDLANEIPVFEYIQRMDGEAKKNNVALVSGIGFGVIASNCLLKLVHEKLPRATKAEVGLHIESAHTSLAAKETGLTFIRFGGRIRKNGKLIKYRLGSGRRVIEFAGIKRMASPLPLGDLEAAWMATGIKDIRAYSTAIKGGLPIQIVLDLLKRLLRFPFIQKALLKSKGNVPILPKSQAWAMVSNEMGKSVETSLETGDGYEFTARAASLAVSSILNNNYSGALAPSSVLGSDFLGKITDTKIFFNEN
jgi:short subunit dehydrogenase-like uncharacterized protein